MKAALVFASLSGLAAAGFNIFLLPACARHCVLSAVRKTKCSVVDNQCLCGGEAQEIMRPFVTDCMDVKCTADEKHGAMIAFSVACTERHPHDPSGP
ncbi:Extracellular membrane protein, CFEM domain protein [Cordyceps fumosorosea ARSEF 2679]|uniref:Extracellular membrane protein, CFEM domain protein n=1 Tax=Cordyceps fumosorosea (strain ARSEF 2679) TaxID=1081104 RepID=A0A168BTF3_CORFA|nr:Extracellular membrane protein, CFEM domain protein [Cordyceps fumosorosea ARSEF 2679]OAA70527.1 Extracellular membrane protein, CFEM domain protein [Cordyceps fumosorosea ARSEF 2679]